MTDTGGMAGPDESTADVEDHDGSVVDTPYSDDTRLAKLAALLEPPVAALLQLRVIAVIIASISFAILLARLTARASDMSEWVYYGYALPVMLGLVYLVIMPEMERFHAIQEGQRVRVTFSAWSGFRHRHARLQRISLVRGRLYLARTVAGVCVMLALLTVATVGLVRYLAHDPSAPAIPSGPPPPSVPSMQPPAPA
ncbi:hypothetical protein [Candidatus Poriferisodalis sp.]|uniref:hypothetical protein n=1 Tax=Candidatus Poriferisodalis sp. TaxID=3101277 RepID=UPI003B021BCD